MADTFRLPDTIAALPRLPFEVSPAGAQEEASLRSAGPDDWYRHLLRDGESEATLLLARRVLQAFLTAAPADDVDPVRVRAELAPAVLALRGLEPDLTEAVARQRAPLALLGGCWLDGLSQPATQPSVIVNRLFAQHVRLLGADDPRRGLHHRRRRALEGMGAYLPDIAAVDFLARARARPLTALHGCFYLALSRLPANFLPEVVGVHYAYYTLGVDDLLTDTSPALGEEELLGVLAAYGELAGPDEQRRLRAAIGLVVALEREHVAMLAELARWRGGLSLEARVAEIIARHGPLAGRQHGGVRVGGRLLAETFGDPELDIAQFLAQFRESGHVKPAGNGGSRFTEAMRLGGPMFGIFDEREAETLRAWVATVQAGERPTIRLSENRVGSGPAERWRVAVETCEPADVVVAEARPRDDRELLYRLVNIENFMNTLPLAAARAQRCFEEAEILFEHGAHGKYTDASWFEYSPEALLARAERVYWEKLVDPYRPLEVIPERDEVLFRQTTYHLTYLIDGAWLHRLGRLGHRERDSDTMLFSIYADEMGYGDLAKNHLTLTHRALASMDIKLPHIRDAAFMDQTELPEEPYGFAIQQLCMCLFPDRFYNEILGYNLAIEMFGAGEVRLHEMQKLNHYGFDDCYERAHLTIDNFSAGHARQAADIIVSYLDSVRRRIGAAAVPAEWRRVWRGYASFAYFLEQPLLRRVSADAELVI